MKRFWKRPVTIDLAPWSFTQRPRVLIEHPDPDRGLELATALRRAGCTVAICRGPDAQGSPPTRCPLHDLQPCVIVEGADVVVTQLGFGREDARGVLCGLRTRYSHTPLVVAADVADVLELENELHGCTVIREDAAPAEVVAAVLDTFAAPAL
jgi:hypothetical protein